MTVAACSGFLCDGAILPGYRPPVIRASRLRATIVVLVAVLVTAAGLPTALGSSPAAAAAVTPSEPVPAARGVYLATEADITVGLATDGTVVRGFVRNGAGSVAAWFDGPLAGNSFDIVLPDRSRIAGAVIGGVAHGRFTPVGGAPRSFAAPAPIAQGALYRGSLVRPDSSRVDAGWVVGETGTVSG